MNLRRLKYFVKIVDIGSLTQAAEVLHIAQPALSQQVATLEGELDQQLLIRTKRGVTPTEAGKILTPTPGLSCASASRRSWRLITSVRR
jgi:LysR family nitrogen assimilation transcriptional regulator